MKSKLFIIMTLVVIAGLRFRLKHKTFRFISWHGVVLLALYGFGVYWLFASGVGLG